MASVAFGRILARHTASGPAIYRYRGVIPIKINRA
jgi:hypothetical protein